MYVLETTQDGSETAVYLGPGEARLVAPAASPESAAGEAGTAGTVDTAADVASSTLWLGCIVADNALMSGTVLRVLGDVATAEACCRACRAASPECNVWNWCQPGATCSFKDRIMEATLAGGQCELRHQQLAEPDFGWPPAVVAKGSGIAFTAGAPLAVTGPPVDGFEVQLGTGLFGQPGMDCPGTLTPELQECVLSRPLAQLADYCLQDAQCAAMVYKPAGIFLTQSGIAYFRRAEGANTSRLIYSPSSILYFRTSQPPDTGSPGTGGGSSFPVAAIAGIAACAAVAAIVAGWALLHWRRRRRRRQRAQRDVLENQLQLTKSPAHTCSSQADEGGSRSLPDSTAPAPQGWGGAYSASPSTTGAMSTTFAAAAAAGVRGPLGTAPSPDSTFALAAASSVLAARSASGPSSHLHPGTPSYTHQAPVSPAQQAWKRRPPQASPFAAQGRRMSEDAARPMQHILPHPSHLPSIPDCLLEPGGAAGGELTGVMAEVLQHRAAQEALHLTHHTLPAAATATATTGSGGTVSTQASGGSSRSQLVVASLPVSLREWVIPASAFEYLRRPTGELHLLGEGASGRVYKSVYNGETIACKEINLERSPQAQEAFVAEAARLQLLRHPLICGFFGVSISDDGRGIILMEYCAGHDLYSVLQLPASGTGQRLFSWYRHGQRIATEVATAVNYLHLKKLVHMDIKSHNVLLDARGVAKLADVGVSRLQTRTFLSQLAPVGTFAWVAPEVLMGGQNCTQAVDIFSFGVLMWEIITGERPVRGQLRMPFVTDECPQDACDLMMQCLSLDPAARPTAQQLMHLLSAMQRDPSIDKRSSV